LTKKMTATFGCIVKFKKLNTQYYVLKINTKTRG
jgi:hypothetical protein